MKTNSIKPRDFFDTLKEVNNEVLVKEQEALRLMAFILRKKSKDREITEIAEILENEWNKALPAEILRKLKALNRN